MTSKTEKVLISGILACGALAILLAFILFPPSRPCTVGSLERVFTNCEARP